jgi:hypothetical protein
VARQPEAIAGTMLRYCLPKHDACQPDKSLISENLGSGWPTAEPWLLKTCSHAVRFDDFLGRRFAPT